VPKKPAVQDYHVVLRGERAAHEYHAGADCPCEPRCILQGAEFRIFVHQTHLIDIVKLRPQPPKGLLGPGK
jgi:hypothetical protein